MMPPSDPVPHLLHVEDNSADVHLTRLALQTRRRSFTLHVATDGEQALAYLQGEGQLADAPAPDLVILDLNLPRVDGATVLSAIRATPSTAELPVVILSSAPLDALDLGDDPATCLIEKPADLDGFLDVGRRIWTYWERRTAPSREDT